jgi:hypothetical protein
MTIHMREFLMRNLYPASKGELLVAAQEHGLDPDAYRLLQEIADREYDTATEVEYALEAAAETADT